MDKENVDIRVAMLPPYIILTLLATLGDTLSASHFLSVSCTSCACSGEAVFPVPMAHTGS
ncbi:hypothetical protein DPMN_130350 [Dreissena polymorpha]|uniref:Uncharacterized protein n=1 Tax=Dreissena polymorpha TaxID=45954 RepID=A0A9D4HAV2_DREPO|nr:hypothetical protein DPMN_130350 [Dreissena polymorpha]